MKGTSSALAGGAAPPKYRLISRLAAGGMGEVFLAKQEGPAGFVKTVVVKRILSHLAADETFVQMFLDEARLAALLSHPNVVQIFELGTQDGSYYIAMEYIEGPSLRGIKNRLSKRQRLMPPALAATIAHQALRGLHYAHDLRDENGQSLHIVHRDISPDNILVGFNGIVKLVDFGIAKAAVNISTTRAGALKGKYNYMAPELLLGHKADARSDLYAMGVVLYEVVTGHRPFTAPNEAELLLSIVKQNPKPPCQLNPQLPQALEQIILRAMAKEPRERFATAEEMASSLTDYLESSGVKRADSQMTALLRELYDRAPPPGAEHSSRTAGLPAAEEKAGSAPGEGAGQKSSSPDTGDDVRGGTPADVTTGEKSRVHKTFAAARGALARLKRILSGKKEAEPEVPAREVVEIQLQDEEIVPVGQQEPAPAAGAGASAEAGAPQQVLEPKVKPDNQGGSSPRMVSSSQRSQLVFLSGPEAGKALKLDRTPLFIVAARGDELLLSLEASPQACCMLYLGTDGQWSVRELVSGSTQVNGKARDSAVLQRGDVLTLRGIQLLFSEAGARRGDEAGPVTPQSITQPESRAELPLPARAPAAAPPGMVRVEARTLQSAYGGTFEVQAFWIERTPVTNADFLAFVQATGEPAPSHWLGGAPPSAQIDHPVVDVSRDAARRYARWKGWRLPTNLEWEAAARGPNGERFPWGDQWDPNRCHGPEQGSGRTAPVGSHPDGASAAGCLDLVGNVWEWTEVDPRTSAPEDDYAWVFGGSYRHPCCENGCIARTSVSGDKEYLYIGFRCVMGTT